MENYKTVLNEAAQEWLECYEAHRKFLAATERLFHAFAVVWYGPRRGLIEAFDSYRQALLLSESNYAHSEVSEVYST